MVNPVNVRFVAPGSGIAPTSVEGRQHASSAAAGTTADVPWGTNDVLEMAANGWIQVAPSGTTAQRPTGVPKGYFYMDTSLGYVVVNDGNGWRNPSSGASV